MDYRRLALAVAAQLAVAGFAVAAWLAWRADLPATTLTAALAAGAVGLIVAMARGRPRVRVVETPAPRVAEGELRSLRLLLDHSPAPLVTLGPDGVLRAVNRAARSLFRADERVLDAPQLTSLLRSGRPGEASTATLGEGSAARTFAVSITELSTPDGASRLAALTDIQGDLHAAEAAALRSMLSILSHELMNSLTPITSLTQTARELLSEPDPQARAVGLEALRTVERRAEGIDRFVRAYRDLARLPPPRKEAVRTADLLEETARLFRARWQQAGVRLEVKATPDAAARTLNVDPQLVLQALINLLANAADAVLSAGRPDPHVRLSAEVDGAGAVLRASDDGDGVDPALRSRLFEPFVTSKPHGAGVGLSLARQIARSHGGDLVLVEAETGATFELRLPVRSVP